MKTSPLAKFILLILALSSFVLFLANAYYVWNWGDDYLIKYFYKEQSPMSYLIKDYFIFDGRSLNPGYIISRICLSSSWPFLATMIASVLLYASSVLLVMMMNRTQKFSFKSDFISSVVVLSILWMALFNSLNEILYWQTGMLYMVELFLILYLYFLVQFNSSKKGLLGGLSFLVGMSSPNAVLGVLLVLVIEQWYLKKQQKSIKNFTLVSGLLILGFLVVVLAPGSSVRWNMQGGADAKAFGNIYEMYFRIQQMANVFFELNTVVVWLMFFGGIAIIIGFGASREKRTFIWYLLEFRWLIAAILSVMFYFPKMSYYIETSRLNCHFVFFTAVFYFTQMGKLRQSKSEIFNLQERLLRWPVLVIAVVLMGTQALGSRHCVKKLEARTLIYAQNQGKDVVLKANDIIGPPRTKWFTDVHEDSSHVFNQSIAYYYGLKSIRREKYR